jgi:preprotein translocase subunit SecD
VAINARKRNPPRVLVALLVLLLALFGGIAAAARFSNGELTPKLGLDLEGGTQMVLEPVLADKNAQVNAGQLDKARDIIQQRVDSYGVSEAEVTTQGGRNIVVSIPGQPDAKTLDAIRKPSQLRFRAVLTVGYGSPAAAAAANPTPTGTATDTPTGTATGTATSTPTATTPPPVFTPNTLATANPGTTPARAALPPALVQEDPTPPAASATTPAASATPPAGSPTPPAGAATTPSGTDTNATPTTKPTSASDLAWVTPELEKQFTDLDCSKPDAVNAVVDEPAQPLATCSDDRKQKYLLGPVEVDGTDIADASSGYQVGPNGQPTNVVEVSLKFTGDGAKKFGDVTTRLLGLQGAQNQFAIVLDKLVISAPTTRAAITNGQASITGSFTIDSARALAQQLKFGALPMSFALQTQEDISPTLGNEQLKLGLLAGLVGLLLVVGYSLLQYRLLGLVTVASLVVAGVLTFGVLTFLGWSYNFRLTLAGVTGVIVAIGVTADSFIVYFERIRDEVREGRPLVAAVEAGWRRARRTILAADAVNFLAAAVLYLLASSNVRGFAFTLGVTTLIDLAVVVLFTHPLVALLAHTRFFGGGHKLSGLDPERLGAKPRYVGRGKFAGPSGSTVTAQPVAEGKA